jgi:hypothetical protein|tara:strand:- start:4 stop:252 length:249 start_codon:yes stop_codon:yes gene_type:complete
MSFVEQEESFEKQIIDGVEVTVYKPRVEITVKHMTTGQEYGSDEEARQDIDDPNTDTKEEDISRSVHIKVQSIPLGGKTNIF